MMICVSKEELAGLSEATRSELLGLISLSAAPKQPRPKVPGYEGIDMEDVYDLTPKQVRTWMEKASDKTKDGMRVFAQHGPVITARQLKEEAGIENTAHFQSRVTIRTRTVTGDKSAFLFGWDDWEQVGDYEGRYGVTEITWESLRSYFGL